MKPLLCLLVSIGLVTGLCGCNQTTPLKDKLIVEGIGVDVKQDDFLVTLQVYMPSTEPSGGSKSQMFSETGTTVYEALSRIDENMGKISFYADTKVIILSYDALKKGLWSNIDPFVRSSEMGSNVCVAATKGKAADLFAIEQEGNNMPAQILANGLRYGKNNGTPVSGELMQVAAGLEDQSSGIAIPMVGVVEKDKKKYPTYEGILCFHGDKPYYVMDQEMKWAYNWLNEYGDNRGLVVQAKEDEVSLFFRETKTRVAATVHQGTPHFTVTVESTCEVTESTHPSALTEQGIRQVTAAAQTKMETLITKTLQTVVSQKGCDVFRLGKNLRKQQPDYFRSVSSWQEQCKTATFTVKAAVKITRVGQQAVG